MTEVSPAAHTQTAFDPFLRHSSHTSYTAMSAPYFGRDHQRHLSRHDSNHHHSSPQTSSPRNSRQNSGSSFTLPPISALLDGIRPSHPAADAPSSYPPHGETQNYSTAYSSRRDYSDNRIPRSNLLNLHPPAGLSHTSSYPEPPPPPPRTSRSSVDSTDYPPIASPSHHRQSWQSQTSQGGSAAPVYPPSPDSRTIADAACWQSSSSLPPLGHPPASLSGAPLSTSPTASFVNVSPLSTKSQWQSHQHSHPHPYFTPAGTGSSSSSGPTHPQSISTSSSSQGQAQQQHDRYVCPTCSKAFSRPSSLRIHSHSHTGHKPFRCPRTGCGKAFSVRSNMKRHERGCHIDGVAGANKAPSSTDHDGDADMGETGSEEEA